MRFPRLRHVYHGVLVSLVAITSVIVAYGIASADEIDEIGRQIADLQHQLELSVNATTPLEAEVSKLNKQLTSIQSQIKASEQKNKELETGIAQREKDLKEQYVILAHKVRSYYKTSRFYSPLLVFVSSKSAADLTRGLVYKSATADQDKNFIVAITTDIVRLEEDKKKVEADKVRLAGLQGKLDKQKDFFEGEIAGAKKWQAELNSKIAALTARQQAILAQKTETFQTTVGDVPLADDPASRPDYSPGFSPAFAAFSFGAPHFKGMSQYGAYGRAKSGQSTEDILRAYYGGVELKKDYRTDINITVQGHGTVDIETYVKRIYEMPSSWTDNGSAALKAQAVAARSYALAYTNNGAKSICATEACQVYKPANKGGAWDAAVEATRGWVLVSGGQPFSAWYASTSGGYQISYSAQGHTTPAFWDTPSGRAGWTSQAYEKVGGSPWFYKGWYKSRSGDACGRSHPWLNGEEMADILNAWVVLVKSGQSDDRVAPQGSCWGGSPYSISELRDKARGLGSGYSKVTGASVTYADNGVTANVLFQTDLGSVSISGSEFKKAFNLRAPGNIALKSNLFNIEVK